MAWINQKTKIGRKKDFHFCKIYIEKISAFVCVNKIKIIVNVHWPSKNNIKVSSDMRIVEPWNLLCPDEAL